MHNAEKGKVDYTQNTTKSMKCKPGAVSGVPTEHLGGKPNFRHSSQTRIMGKKNRETFIPTPTQKADQTGRLLMTLRPPNKGEITQNEATRSVAWTERNARVHILL